VKLSDSQIIARVANDGLRPEVPVYCPWSELMQRCWDEKPSDRPGFKFIVDTLHHIYNQERADKSSFTATGRHLSTPPPPPPCSSHISILDNASEEDEEANRKRHFYYSDDSEESKGIGDSF
jgi:hypothetical protein